MNFEMFIAFIVYAFVSGITPGPNNTMLMASGLHFGVRKTVPHIAGVVLGFALMIFSVGMGLLSLLNYIPYAYETLHVISIIYLLYLAYKIATAEHLKTDKAPKHKPMTFLQAAAFQWVNPKGLMMAMIAISTYVPEDTGFALLWNVSVVTGLFTLVNFPCAVIWAAMGTGLRRFLTNPKHFRIFNVVMAGLLVLSLYPMLSIR